MVARSFIGEYFAPINLPPFYQTTNQQSCKGSYVRCKRIGPSMRFFSFARSWKKANWTSYSAQLAPGNIQARRFTMAH